LELFSKGNPHNGIPNKHEGDERQKEIPARAPFVAQRLVNHPNAPDTAAKQEGNIKEEETDISKKVRPDPDPE
jgi:hypothetical protein